MNDIHAANMQTAVTLSVLLTILAFALIEEQPFLAVTMIAVLIVVAAIAVFERRKKKGKLGE